MRTVTLRSMGCKLNFADTDRLAHEFEQRSYVVVEDVSDADVTVINSCSVTAEADRKCRQLVRRCLEANPSTFLIVTGCYAQLQPGAIAGIEGVDLVLGTRDKFRVFDVVDSFRKRERTQVEVSCISDARSFNSAASTSRTRTFLKIQDGCDYSCSFCTIPLARGRSRSDDADRVLERVQRHAQAGIREIVLSGVNIGLYESGRATSLLDLLRRLDKVEFPLRYRISSIEPNLLTDAIIDFVAESRLFAPHFHVPLQSGDDYVLGKMRRRYTTALYRSRVDRIVARCPDACIGADVMVGFPEEDDSRFQNTFRFLSDLPLSYLHVFSYSPRPDTPVQDRLESGAIRRPAQATRSRRSAILRGLSESKRKTFYKSQLDKTATVLWESPERDDVCEMTGRSGYTANYVRVTTTDPGCRRGTTSRVRLTRLEESKGQLTVQGTVI